LRPPGRPCIGSMIGPLNWAGPQYQLRPLFTAAESVRAQTRLNMAVEIAHLHVWEVDYATGKVVTAGAADTFFDGSYDTAAMIADPTLAIHPDDRARVVEPWAQAVVADTPFRAEYRVNRGDDALVWAAASVRLVKNDAGEPVQMIGAIQNITAQKQTELALIQAKEDAEAANRAKSVFLATMSHEVRTPLNGVLGMAQAMAADDLPPAQRSRLETIRQSGESLLVILNDVLDLSKIEAGKLELEAVDFPLSPLLQAIHASFRDLAGAKGLALDFEIAAGAPGLYRGDPTRLRQILFNLLSNSLKFTEAGRIGLAVRRDRDVLTFSVRDTGVGIPADRLGRLFNKFEQADASTTRKFGGTGLGLAISRDLAGLMGGALEADSREGEGSEFRLSVPLPRLGDEDAGERATGEAAPVRPASLRVLAAEDNHVNQLVLRTLLQQVGVEPVIVDDGAAAVAAWRGQDWDLILMDVQMPVMDGPTATRAIRAAEAAAGRRRTPVVALTANAMSHQVAEYAAAGMDGFIAKPIRVEELYAALEGVLDDDQTAAA